MSFTEKPPQPEAEYFVQLGGGTQGTELKARQRVTTLEFIGSWKELNLPPLPLFCLNVLEGNDWNLIQLRANLRQGLLLQETTSLKISLWGALHGDSDD